MPTRTTVAPSHSHSPVSAPMSECCEMRQKDCFAVSESAQNPPVRIGAKRIAATTAPIAAAPHIRLTPRGCVLTLSVYPQATRRTKNAAES